MNAIDFLLQQHARNHSAKVAKWEGTNAAGLNQEEIDTLRGQRDSLDPLTSAMAAEVAVSIYGLEPPDLSLITRARDGGGRFIYTLLTSYAREADGKTVNRIFPGFRMPDMLGYAGTTDNAKRRELEGKIHDVAAFLEWAADPHAGERRRLGYLVIVYLVILTLLLYMVKRRTWRDLDQGEEAPIR